MKINDRKKYLKMFLTGSQQEIDRACDNQVHLNAIGTEIFDHFSTGTLQLSKPHKILDKNLSN